MEDLTTVTGFFRHSFRSSLTSSGVSVRVSLHSFLLPRVVFTTFILPYGSNGTRDE